MASRVRLDTSELDELASKWEGNLKELANLKRIEATRLGNIGVAIIVDEYETGSLPSSFLFLPTIDTGALGASFSFTVRSGPKQTILSIVNDASYFPFVEEGRGGGGVPVDIIKDWAQRKLGLDPESQDVKNIIARIRQFGIEGRQLMFYSFAPGTPGGFRFEQEVEAAADRILNMMVDAV